MAGFPERLDPEVRLIVRRFEERLRLARAGEFASCNRLLEAEVLLCFGGRRPDSIDELDLLARIHVRQSQFGPARQCWEAALRSGHRRGEIEDCLRELEAFRLRVYRRRILLWGLVLGAVLVVVGLSHLFLAEALSASGDAFAPRGPGCLCEASVWLESNRVWADGVSCIPRGKL